ncbi:MAG: triose-phosphate isomerase [Candidatus Omnitrophota bacterium]|nr:triose-phosphate isomerase [Candidatus Omnitrophota bacterium]
MRKPIIAGNWKMHKTIGEALELANGLKRELCDIEVVDIVVCPGFTLLEEVGEVILESNIKLGAQNAHWEIQGAFTGEVSVQQLKDLEVKYAIIGHSERRQFFGETNEAVNKRVKAVLKAGLIPIMCVGENLAERESNKIFKVIEEHVRCGLKEIEKEEVYKVVIAYEPVWAIGTGKTATPQQAQEVHNFIRSQLSKLYDDNTAQTVRIQYGGSVKPDNIVDLMSEKDIDGALVGGASLDVKSFAAIVKGSIFKKG